MAKKGKQVKPGARQGPAALASARDAAARNDEAVREAAAVSTIAADTRFKAALVDPRFGRGLSRKQRTVAIDDRFAGMFTHSDFQTKPAVDKRGRKVPGGAAGKADDLRRFYRLRDEDDWKAPGQQVARAGGEKPPQVTHPATKEQTAASKPTARPPGGATLPDEDLLLGGESSSGDELASDSTDGSVASTSADSSADDEAGDRDGVVSSSEDEGAQDGSEGGDEGAKARWAHARGIDPDALEGSDSGNVTDDDDNESYDSADDPLTDDEAEEDEDTALQRAVAEWGVGALAANPAERIPAADQTFRLAVLDQDWQHTRAVDLMAGLRSFVPKGGSIRRVTVYPSDYGLQRMAEEEVKGPQGILGGRGEGADGGSEGEAEASEEERTAEQEVDIKRVRMYERSKLRYYYAIVECDSVATAAALYAECDGMEFEHSACKLDLRFVPDDQSFAGRQVRDEATSVPADYKPPDTFTTSLQHTDPTLTWDQDDIKRKRVLQKKMTEDEIKEADFTAFLASGDEEEEEEAEAWAPGSQGAADNGGNPGLRPPSVSGAAAAKKDVQAIRERYRSLLLGADADGDAAAAPGRTGTKSWVADAAGAGEDADPGAGPALQTRHGRQRDDLEMEVTYTPGLEGLGSRLLAAKKEAEARKGETVWDAYLRRRAEKKREKRQRRRRAGADSSDDEDDDDSDGQLAGRRGAAGSGGPAQANGTHSSQGAAKGGEDDPFNDPFFEDAALGEAVDSSDDEGEAQPQRMAPKAGVKGKSSKAAIKAKAAKAGGTDAAELELLMMDDDDLRLAAVKPYAGAAAGAAGVETERDGGAVRGKKARQAARKRAAKEAAAALRDDAGAGFAADLSDPRFRGMIQDPDYAMDPTDPRFKSLKDTSLLQELTKARKQQQQQRKEQGTRASSGLGQATHPDNTGGAALAAQRPERDELRGMVAKLKRKAQKAPGIGPDRSDLGTGKKARKA